MIGEKNTTRQIFYIMATRLPSGWASSLQAINTCAGFVENGFPLIMFIRKLATRKVSEVFNYYGLEGIYFPIKQVPTINTLRLQTWSFSLFSALYAIFESLRRGKPLLIYIRGLLTAFIFLLFIKPLLKVPIIYETQEISWKTSQVLSSLVGIKRSSNLNKILRIRQIEHKVCKRVDYIVVGTEYLKRELVREGVPREKICVAPDGVFPKRFQVKNEEVIELREKLGVSNYTVIGYIGQLYPWKGVDSLLEAISFLPDKLRRKIRVLIVGGSYNQEYLIKLREMTKSLSLSNIVKYTGFVNPREVPKYLKAIDIAVIPTPDTVLGREAMPIKIFEYMISGKPIIATDIPPHRQIFEECSSKIGVLVKPDDPKDLAEAIAELVEKPDLRKEWGENARREALLRYTWKARVQRILKFLGSSLKG